MAQSFIHDIVNADALAFYLKSQECGKGNLERDRATLYHIETAIRLLMAQTLSEIRHETTFHIGRPNA